MLDRATYLQLEKPSEKEPVRRFAAIDPKLYDAALNLCVEPGKLCMNEMMRIDGKGGLGLEGARNVRQLEYDKSARRGSATIVLPAAGNAPAPKPAEPAARHPHPSTAESGTRRDAGKLMGAGMAPPGRRNRDGEPGNSPRPPLIPSL